VAVADGGGASRAERTALGAAEYLGAVMAWLDGDYPVARHRAARAAALWAALETMLATLPDADAARRWATLKLGLALEIEAQAIAMLGDPQAGLAVMDRAVASAERTGDARHLAAVSARRGFVRMAVGDAAGAEADFAAAVRTYRAIGEGWLLSLAYQGMAVHALALDRVPEALARARACVAVVRDEGNSWFLSRGLDTLAAALVRAAPQATGDDAARLALATELLGAADGLRRRTGVVLSPYDQAMQAGAVEAARARLGPDAFEAAWTRGGTLPEAALLARVTESVTEGERAVDADAPLAPATTAAAAVPATTAHPVTPHPAPTPAAPTVAVAAAPAPPALQLLAFGPLAVVRAGVVLPSGEMSPAKARELLLYLLLHPPRTKEQVALVLWPEASEAQVRNAFHVVLHHVRRILGGKDRVTFDGGSYRLARDGAPGGFDADVDAVLAAAEAARAAERRRAPVDAGTRARWAAALGRHERGMLGEGMDAGDWLVAHQDRVRAAWAGGLEALARLHAAAGAQADAAALLETLVARDPLREGAHRALMQAYAAMGEPARALAHHEQLVALLDRELGAKPARETRALADALRQGSGARG
jgi:DNA-binding SARP family transcriptional activator